MRARIKRLALGLLHPGWGGVRTASEGYTFVIPAPMDLPFLTYLSLEGLRHMDLARCREFLVVPDACAGDGGRALADAVRLCGLPGTRLLPVPRRNRATLSLFGHSGIAHWLTIVQAIREARTDLLYLHDSDAFFTSADLIEANYRACRDRRLASLGVTTRWDPRFADLGVRLPGTWELMFSASWARKWSPVDHKAGVHATPAGPVFFDTMLYPQYRDFASGRIAVAESDDFVHLSGTVVTYRRFLDFSSRRVGDELFRLLFLSLLKELTPPIDSECRLPSVAGLARGLDDSARPVHYCFPDAAANYREFRDTTRRLAATKLFAPRRETIDRLLAPFDDRLLGQDSAQPAPGPRMRSHGLWLG